MNNDLFQDNHLLGYDATLQTPQVFPLASLINPFSPQLAPQEFLMTQDPLLVPTKVTPWLREVLQLLKTPEEYLDQLVASTATEIGLSFNLEARSEQLLISV